jgi:16S rRNA (guanine(966)-N(2))-methyltransferase RsmD
MRIVAGSAGGLHLKVPKGQRVRPTQERVKEAVFDILVSRFSVYNIQALDLFAGSGSLGIEALSRGARRVVFVEPNLAAWKVLAENLRISRLYSRGRILKATVLRGLKIVEAEGTQFGGVFLDPPYGQGWINKILPILARSPILEEEAWVVAEHGSQERVADSYPPLALTDQRHYGTTWVSFYVRQPESEEAK